MEQEKIELPPLDLDKVEGVVDSHLTKHIKHKHGAVVFVGSGGGKSTTCRNQTPNEEGKTDFIDADLVYRETEAHPLQPGVFPPLPLPWWNMGIEVIREVDRRCGQVNQSMIEHGLWAFTTSFDQDDLYVPDGIVVVMLPWEEQKKRIIEKFNSSNYDAGAQPTEQGFAIAQRHRAEVEGIAREKGIPIVDSIDMAIEMLREREK